MSAQIKRYTSYSKLNDDGDGYIVLHTDHLAAIAAASAYDEEKERALFEGEFPYVSHSGSYDSWVSRWKYTHGAVDSLWVGWLACAKARAKAAGCL